MSLFPLEQPFERPRLGRRREDISSWSDLVHAIGRTSEAAEAVMDTALPVLPETRARLLAEITRCARARVQAVRSVTSPDLLPSGAISAVTRASVRQVAEFIILMRLMIWSGISMGISLAVVQDSTGRLAVLFGVYSAGLLGAAVWVNRYPERFILYFLLSALADVAYHPGEWRHARFRRRVLRQLEVGADCIAKMMPRQCRTKDRINHACARESFGQIAAAVRSWGLLAAIPGPTSRQQFLAKLAGAVGQIAVADWDGMEHIDPAERPGITAKAQRAERVWLRIRRAMAVGGVLVMAGMLVLSYSNTGGWLGSYRPVLGLGLAALLPLAFSSSPPLEQLVKLGDLLSKNGR
jgi:hypothetical protein